MEMLPIQHSSEQPACSQANDEKSVREGVENAISDQCPEAPVMTSLRWGVLCSALLLTIAQAALDTTMTANLQPLIIGTFGEVAKLPWTSVTYNLCQGATCLLWGKLQASFDSKKILLFTRVLFIAGCALTAAAPCMNAFIVGKAINGVAGSGCYITVIIIITALMPPVKHSQYFGYIGFVWGLGTMIGPTIGGAFAASAGGWRWSFYFNLILVGPTLPVFLFVLPSRKTPLASTGFWSRVRRIDFAGSVLFAGAICSFIMAISFGGALYPWSNGRIIGLLCCSVFLGIAFGFQQSTCLFTTKENRIVPLHILGSLEMWILILQTGCSIGIVFITVYYVPLYFQFVRGQSAIRSALDLLPFLTTTVFAMLISGPLIARFGYYKLWFMVGSSLALIMCVGLYRIKIDTSHGQIYGFLILGGIGLGLYAMNTGPVMAAIVAKEHVADAGTIFGGVDNLCGAFSVGIANSIFINRATDGIQKLLPTTPRAVVQEAITGVGARLTDELPPSLRTAVLEATLEAIRDAWVQTIATAALSLVLCFFLRTRRLSDSTRERLSDGSRFPW